MSRVLLLILAALCLLVALATCGVVFYIPHDKPPLDTALIAIGGLALGVMVACLVLAGRNGSGR